MGISCKKNRQYGKILTFYAGNDDKNMPPSFSVVMSVYAQESPTWLTQCLESLKNQTLTASEIVLVQDGPLPAALQEVIARYQALLPLNIVPLPTNQGLAHALQVGIEHSNHEWLARMDADDIAHPERFRRQFEFLAERSDIDVLGTWTLDFEDTPSRPCGSRCPPSEPAQLANYARKRCPLNHMTVVYRKSALQAVGGYQGFRGIEDYYLWAKLIVAGYKIANLPELLVYARGGGLVAERRGGIHYLRTEAALYIALVRIGFMTKWSAFTQFILRVPVRLLPNSIRGSVYRLLRRYNGANAN